MSVHDEILARIVTTLEEVGCGRVHNRRRWFDSTEHMTEQCTGGEGEKVLQAAMVSLGSVVRGDERIERGGGGYDTRRTRQYKILIIRAFSDSGDSENAVANLVERLIDHFDTDAVRARFAEVNIKIHSLQAPTIGQGMWFDTLVTQAELSLDTEGAMW